MDPLRLPSTSVFQACQVDNIEYKRTTPRRQYSGGHRQRQPSEKSEKNHIRFLGPPLLKEKDWFWEKSGKLISQTQECLEVHRQLQHLVAAKFEASAADVSHLKDVASHTGVHAEFLTTRRQQRDELRIKLEAARLESERYRMDIRLVRESSAAFARALQQCGSDEVQRVVKATSELEAYIRAQERLTEDPTVVPEIAADAHRLSPKVARISESPGSSSPSEDLTVVDGGISAEVEAVSSVSRDHGHRVDSNADELPLAGETVNSRVYESNPCPKRTTVPRRRRFAASVSVFASASANPSSSSASSVVNSGLGRPSRGEARSGSPSGPTVSTRTTVAFPLAKFDSLGFRPAVTSGLDAQRLLAETAIAQAGTSPLVPSCPIRSASPVGSTVAGRHPAAHVDATSLNTQNQLPGNGATCTSASSPFITWSATSSRNGAYSPTAPHSAYFPAAPRSLEHDTGLVRHASPFPPRQTSPMAPRLAHTAATAPSDIGMNVLKQWPRSHLPLPIATQSAPSSPRPKFACSVLAASSPLKGATRASVSGFRRSGSAPSGTSHRRCCTRIQQINQRPPSTGQVAPTVSQYSPPRGIGDRCNMPATKLAAKGHSPTPTVPIASARDQLSLSMQLEGSSAVPAHQNTQRKVSSTNPVSSATVPTRLLFGGGCGSLGVEVPTSPAVSTTLGPNSLRRCPEPVLARVRNSRVQ